MKKEARKQQHFCRYIHFIRVILILLCLSLGIVSPSAYAKSMNSPRYFFSSCPAARQPTNSSLLVVLLDRSGSLQTTDPGGYATSVTKALADLWPGPIAVIPFSGDGLRVSVLGPASVDFGSRTTLKNQVDQYPISGNTPLNLAMQQALSLLRKASPGSRAILLTDGQPTGSGKENTQSQEQDIRQHLIPQFCRQSTPVSVFGLMIGTSTQSGRDADRLLTDINNGTGAGPSYSYVESPEELASSIIGLYANWLDLDFSQLTLDPSGIYSLSIDAFAQEISVITFRANNDRNITLLSPDGQVIQGVQRSTPPDKHYEIDSVEIMPPIIPGIYKVDAGTASDTQVYALVTSPLRVQVISPRPNSTASTNQVIEIQASLYDGQDQLTPASNEAQVRAYITLIGGKTVSKPPEVDLKQLGSIFSNQTSGYAQTGVLRIEVRATYKGANRNTFVTLDLEQPLAQPTQISGGLLAAVLLVLGAIIVLLLLERKQKKGIRKPSLH